MRRWAHIFFLLCLPVFISVPAWATYRAINKYFFEYKDLHFRRATLSTGKDGVQYLELSDTSYNAGGIKPIHDLVLSFNKGPRMLMDDNGNYQVFYSDFIPVTKGEVRGKGAAYFFKAEHRLELVNSKGRWLTESDDLGSFTIEFRFNASRLNDGAVLFSRMGRNSGRSNGIEITFQDNRLHVQLADIFIDQKGEGHSYSFYGTEGLLTEKWYYWALSYDRLTGRLILLQNGEEINSFYITEKGTKESTLLKPCFYDGDVPDVVIAENYYGYLDEMRISYRSFDDLQLITPITDKGYVSVTSKMGNLPVNSEGVVTSGVYEFPYTGTMVKDFSWKEHLDPETFVWFEIRLADTKFGQMHASPRWYRVVNNQRNIYLTKLVDNNSLFLRGKYIQWRAHLIPSPDGKRSPQVRGIGMEFELDVPPSPPIFAEVVEAGDKFVKIRWKKSVDHDLGGYRVYYGIRSRHYEGVICESGGKKLTNRTLLESRENGQYVELIIDNNLVSENRRIDKTHVMSYPLIKNNILYYFALTAYDTYRMGSEFNHESDFSDEIQGRPFGGSEIKVE